MGEVAPESIMADCGHETLITDQVTAFGKTTTTTIPVKNGKTPYCHRCLEKMAIQCAWCDNPIFIGDPVTLYEPKKDNPRLKPHATWIGNAVVGCLSIHCADTGADRAGFWYPPGKVKRASILEAALQGDAVFVRDISDPKESPEPLNFKP